MAKDPYRYFRIEAQELLEGLSQGLLALETSPDKEQIKRLLRLAHTFKGASRVVRRTDLGDLAHKLEDVLSPLRDSEGKVERERIDEALALLDEMRALVILLVNPPVDPIRASEAEPAPLASETPTEEEQSTIRIPVSDLDTVLECALEAHSAASSLRRQNHALAEISSLARDLLSDMGSARETPAGRKRAAMVERLIDDLQQAQRSGLECTERVLGELAELRTSTSELRLVPAQTLMGDLERVVRDAARALDKDVELHAAGTETHIDAHVLAGLRKALIHLVRNCVAHGIEDRVRRSDTGKPPTGRIDIRIRRLGHRVAISCGDDGHGLDLEQVRRVALERKLVGRDEARDMDDAALARLLLQGGVSTSASVGGISGRGVGLDAVRNCIESLKGEVSLHSSPGKGTVVELLAPLSLASLPTLAVDVAGDTHLLPLDCVRQALRLAPEDIARDADGERVAVDGQVVPYLPLRRALDHPGVDVGELQSAVVIEAEGQRAVLGIDRLGAARNIVIRGIPEHAATDPIISGAAFDDAGSPMLVLAPAAMIRAASTGAYVAEAEVVRQIPPLLVIDDSLTTRMLEQSILESAGYEVDVAVSAEDGLEKAHMRDYGVFVVDVEMPGMSGFDFIETIRKDGKLKDTPAILVTSRDDPADKLRGKRVGAHAYIVKSEFDQGVLLELIRGLLE